MMQQLRSLLRDVYISSQHYNIALEYRSGFEGGSYTVRTRTKTTIDRYAVVLPSADNCWHPQDEGISKLVSLFDFEGFLMICTLNGAGRYLKPFWAADKRSTSRVSLLIGSAARCSLSSMFCICFSWRGMSTFRTQHKYARQQSGQWRWRTSD